MRKTIFTNILFCILLLAVGTADALAQTATTGAITGTVRDQTQSILPGVSVSIINLATGEKLETLTNDMGVYNATLLKPGTYTIEFSLAGFKRLVREGVNVRVTETLVVDAILEVGEVEEKVTVVGEAAILQTETAALGRVIDERQITQLPLVTRNFTHILALSPGVISSIPDTSVIGVGSQDPSVSGSRLRDANTLILDGVEADNFVSGTLGVSVVLPGTPVPNTDTIKEFKVQTSLYDATFGRSAGGSISVVTKSGGNEFHGTLYEFFRNDALNANDFFFNRTGTAKPVIRHNQFGYTLGGRIIRDKTFFFTSYQGTRQRNGASLAESRTALVLPPIPPVRTRETLGAVFGGQTGRFGGVAVAKDGSNINPVALALLNAKLPNGQFLIPSPQVAGPGVNFTFSEPAKFKEDQFIINIDHQLAEKNKLAGRWFFSETPQNRPFFRNTLPGFGVRNQFRNRQLTLSNLHTFSPRAINEARFGFSRLLGSISPEQPIKASDVGIQRFNSSLFPALPQIILPNNIILGPGDISDQFVVGNSFNYYNTFSYNIGGHGLRAGFVFRRQQTNFFANVLFFGQMIFLTFPDFLLGLPAGPVGQGGNGTIFSNVFGSIVASGNSYRNWRTTESGFFFQDDWKVSKKFTLNLGLRYELNGPMSDTQGRFSNFIPRLFRPAPPGGNTTAGFVVVKNITPEFRSRVPDLPMLDRSTRFPNATTLITSPRVSVSPTSLRTP